MNTQTNTHRLNKYHTFIVRAILCLCVASTASADRTAVQTGEMTLLLEKAEQGLRVLSLKDNATGRELLAPDTPSLFGIELRHAKSAEQVTLAADSGWRRVEISDVDASGQRVLTFQEPADDRLKGISVEVKLLVSSAENALIWDLQVTNNSEQWAIWQIVFPQVTMRYMG